MIFKWVAFVDRWHCNI